MIRQSLVRRALVAAGLAFALAPGGAQEKAAPEKPSQGRWALDRKFKAAKVRA